MLQYDSAVSPAFSNKPRLVVSRRTPVLIPEDSLSEWRNLRRCLERESDLMVVRCPAPISDLLTHCSKLKPCTLIIDQSRLDQMDANRFMQTADYGRSVSVLVRVNREDSETLKQLLRLGCMGFVTERSSTKELRQAIRALLGGELWASARVVAEFTRDLLATPNPQNLTARESQVLQLITRGLSNREISKELFISRETVRWHIRTLYAKIGARNREEAAQIGVTTHEELTRLPAVGTPC